MQPSPPPKTMLADPPEVFEAQSTRVACDGGGGALGHPLVYMEMGDSDFVECGYCDRRFVLKGRRGETSELAAPAPVAPEHN